MLDRKTFLRATAHRGLHDAANGVIENTAPAFEAAMAKGYGIECDLRPAAGGLPLVFHDATIERLIEGSGPVAALQAGCAAKVRFKGTEVTGILTFAALLDLVAGRVPLLVEVKSDWGPPDAAFLGQIAQIAMRYGGPLALMSFDPAVMAALKGLAPRVPRGIVTGNYYFENGEPWYPGLMTDTRRRALANLEESAPADPCFYAYDVRALPSAVAARIRGELGLPLFTWTVRTAEQRRVAAQYADAPIFEGWEG